VFAEGSTGAGDVEALLLGGALLGALLLGVLLGGGDEVPAVPPPQATSAKAIARASNKVSAFFIFTVLSYLGFVLTI